MNPVGVRWAVDIGDWTPEEPETAFLASLLPSNERAAVAAYVRPTDARRALVSRLLQRACVSTVLGIPFDCVQIKTTRGKKPFAANRASERKCAVDAPNFNYNVTHEGRYVCIAAETHLLVGADVAAPREARGGAAGGAAGSAGRTNAGGNTTAAHSHAIGGGGGALLGGALQRFAGCFAPCEWRLLHSAPHDEQRTEATFQRLWSLKEAFIKARGDGLGFAPLSRAAFQLQPCAATATSDAWAADAWGGGGGYTGYDDFGGCSAAACVTLDGVPQREWAFDLHDLAHGHVVSVARGPPSAAVDANGEFRATFQRPDLSPAELADLLSAPAPPFSHVTVEELLPVGQLEAYFAVRGG